MDIVGHAPRALLRIALTIIIKYNVAQARVDDALLAHTIDGLLLLLLTVSVDRSAVHFTVKRLLGSVESYTHACTSIPNTRARVVRGSA